MSGAASSVQRVQRSEGEAKFWRQPEIELVRNYGLPRRQLQEMEAIVEENYVEIINAWREHFGD